MHPASDRAEDLLVFGWRIAELTLERAVSQRTLVTHWFQAPGDDSVNADEHFGSDERTLRFLGVAVPTLMDQLDARLAVVALPWGLETDEPTLSVIALTVQDDPGLETRGLSRLPAQAGPPFWRLAPGLVTPPAQLAATASRLVR